MQPDLTEFFASSSNRAIGACLGIMAVRGDLKPEDLGARWEVKVTTSTGRVHLVGPRKVVIVEGDRATAKKKTAKKKAAKKPE